MDLIKKIRLVEEGDMITVETEKDRIPELLIEQVKGDLFNSEITALQENGGVHKISVDGYNDVKLIDQGSVSKVVDVEPSSEEILIDDMKLDGVVTDRECADEIDDGVELCAEDIEVLGDCPVCGCVVVEEDAKAICTSCNKRCSIDQWEMFENEQGVQLHKT